jgi:hypothetical protein
VHLPCAGRPLGGYASPTRPRSRRIWPSIFALLKHASCVTSPSNPTVESPPLISPDPFDIPPFLDRRTTAKRVALAGEPGNE